MAFRVGGQWKAGNGAVLMGAHTDSPVFKLKPLSKADAHGYLRAAVQPYGGGLWHTWFDRELSLAGRVIVYDPETQSYSAQLVDLERPVMRIPNLAIHLNRDVGTKGFNPNKESETVPIMGTQLVDQEIRERAKAEQQQQGDSEEAKDCCKVRRGSEGRVLRCECICVCVCVLLSQQFPRRSILAAACEDLVPGFVNTG